MTIDRPAYRKVYAGVATNSDLIDLHDRRADLSPPETSEYIPYTGEWFEIDQSAFREASSKRPRLFAKPGLFAASEYKEGFVTSVYFAIRIRGFMRWFHGFCDLSDPATPDRMRIAIIAEETAAIDVMAMDRKVGFLRDPHPPAINTLPSGRRRIGILRRLGAEIDAASALPGGLSDEEIDAYLNDGLRDPDE